MTLRGTIKFFSPYRGYGFITQADGTDLFLHGTELTNYDRNRLMAGDVVSYQVGMTSRGPRARYVRVIEWGPAEGAGLPHAHRSAILERLKENGNRDMQDTVHAGNPGSALGRSQHR